MNQDRFDVIVAGGGLVGLSLVAVLARAGLRVALIEAREPPPAWPEDSVDLRVYAISRASENFLRETGAWPAIAPFACAYREMQVWDASGSGAIHFDSAELGEPNLGAIVESRVIERALLQGIDSLDTVTRFRPATIAATTDTEAGRCVELEDGRELRASLLVGADGKQSSVRDLADIPVNTKPYDQAALVAVVRCERHHADTAWQRFLPTGPLAFLPLRDGRCSIVWSMPGTEADRLLALDNASFCQALGRAFDHRLGQVLEVGERARFPLLRQYAERTIAARLALVGDAAHVIHPLAGQGVNLGFKDARTLADLVVQAHRRRDDIGAFSLLRRYERARKGDNLATLFTMDAFKQLFGSRVLPVRWLRNAGLDAVNAAAPLKHQLMRAAMGL